MTRELTEASRSIVRAMVEQAVARCDREGIALKDFLAAMLVEQRLQPVGTVVGLIERTFRRIGASAS